MSTTQTINPADIICGLKAAITALECYHNMDMLKQQQQKELKQKKRSPMFVMIPIEEKGIRLSRKKSSIKHKAHISTKVDTKLKRKDSCDSSLNIPHLNFPEMRNGILFTRCYCVHRDGLQDSCPLSNCHGQPKCLTKPWPTCPPAKYLQCHYPEQYPAT